VRVAARWGADARWPVTGTLGSPNVTTVTPSDRAAADSAKRSATIPTQRSGQALRLLVLGTGQGAATFRERAAESGAELAQRFSVRVTHVVVEDGIGAEDARVVRAQTAGVPVLDLTAGASLIAGVEGEAEAQSMPEVEASMPEVEAEAEAGSTPKVKAEAEVGTEAEVEAEAVSDATVEDVPLIRPRTEFAPEPVDVASAEIGPADVFTGSALEAVLLFPPLADAESEQTREVREDLSRSALDVPRSALMEVASEACGCGTAEAGSVEVDVDARGIEGTDDIDSLDVADGAGAIAGLSTDSSRGADVSSGWAAASVAWALVPLASLGLLTPVAMGYAAYRLRSRGLWAATAGYALAVAVAFTLSAAAPLRTGGHAAVGDLLTACLAASWLGGTVHGFLIRRRVFG
jgi:hypothetical protein